MDLYENYQKIVTKYFSVASSRYLNDMGDTIKLISQSQDKNIEIYKKEINSYLQKIYDSFDEVKIIEQLSQKIGECHFFIESTASGINLQRNPEQKNIKTPDFKAIIDGKEIFFEVKTFAPVNGYIAIKKDLSDSIDVNIELETQMNAGKRVAMVVSESNTYGDKLYKGGYNKQLLNLIKILIDKYKNNFKSGQYRKPTFSVINLMLCPPARTHNAILRPYYPANDDPDCRYCLTGELWTMCFGTIGMPIMWYPEFAGKESIVGVLDMNGVMIDTDEENVLGVIFMIYSIGGKYKGMFGLSTLKNEEFIVEEVLYKLTNKNWNDQGDSNCWQLQKTTAD